MGKAIRRVLLASALLLTVVAGLTSGETAASAADGCSHFLFQEDATLNGWDCPDLPALSATGVVRERPEGKKGRVREIIDGDTIRVSFGDELDTIRIIGVDTPETTDPDTPEECYGAEATAYTASLIPVGSIIWLERDITERDRYDRLLRYVWFEQGEGRYRLLQDAIVRDGYGVVSTYPPDVKYVDWLTQAQDDAVAAGRGLWSSCGGADTPLTPPTPTPEPAEPAANQAQGIASNTGCDASYPGVCIPPIAQTGDLDCGDVSFRRFQVVPPDPHGFDGDFDGIGCESG